MLFIYSIVKTINFQIYNCLFTHSFNKYLCVLFISELGSWQFSPVDQQSHLSFKVKVIEFFPGFFVL